MTIRVPLTVEQLELLPVYSQLHESLVDILTEHGSAMEASAVFALEDALLAALKPSESRSDFVELSMLSSGVPHLIRAVERTWANSRVFVDQFQNPESLGVSLSMVIHEDTATWPSLADSVLDSSGKIVDPLVVKG